MTNDRKGLHPRCSRTSSREYRGRSRIPRRPSAVVCHLDLGWPGSDLLFRALRRSTIGAEGFHGRVRDGIGCLAPRQYHQASGKPEDGERTAKGKERTMIVSVCSLSSVI